MTDTTLAPTEPPVATERHLAAKHQRPPDLGSAAHLQLRALLGMATP